MKVLPWQPLAWKQAPKLFLTELISLMLSYRTDFPCVIGDFESRKNKIIQIPPIKKISFNPVLLFFISQSRIPLCESIKSMKAKKYAAATNATTIFKKGKKEVPGNSRLVSLTVIPEQVMEQPILETISRHTNDKNMTRGSQHGFAKG